MISDAILEIFRMPDSDEELYVSYPFLLKYRMYIDDNYKALSRRKEILSEKIIIEKLFPCQNVLITHNENGMPLLSNGFNISISHTRNHVAMMVSKNNNVALDIEHISDRVRKVGRMFLRKDEKFMTTNEMLVVWCTKETMYKLFSSQNLMFDEILVYPFELLSEGCVEAENTKSSEKIIIRYKITSEYVLTTTFVPIEK